MREFVVGSLKIVARPHSVSLFSGHDMIPMTSELIQSLTDAGNLAWKNLNYHDVTGSGNDYYEYYDKGLDNNGYLTITKTGLLFNRPIDDTDKVYQFNKVKFETFMYDLLKVKEAVK